MSVELLDLFSNCNNACYNIRIAQILGLHTAIYISEIANINSKAIHKDKLEENFFTLDRKYLKDRTTLSEKEQIEIENNLFESQILQKSEVNPDKLCLNIEVLIKVLTEKENALATELKSVAKEKKKSTKADKTTYYIENAKKVVMASDPYLRQAYFGWIESICTRYGYITTAMVIAAEAFVNNYAGNNIEIAKGLVNKAASLCYKDINWAVKAFNEEQATLKNVSKKTAPNNSGILLSEEVF